MDRTPKLLLLRIASLALLLYSTSGSSFPKNLDPISVIELGDVPNSVFTGGNATSDDKLRYVQQVKMMKIAGRMFVTVSGRENLFIIKPEDFSPEKSADIAHYKVFTWNSDTKAKNWCVLKGQSQENCENYIRVVEPMDKNGNKLLICATNSYEPLCRYVWASMNLNELVLTPEDTFSGAEKCAFGPDQTGVSLYTGNSLYSATVTDFYGRSYTITRNLGSAKQLRTPKFDSNFLNEPSFVKMVDDGERVLIFINEMYSTEDGDIRMMAYVAQVCKNDVGGQHVLVRQWTKFEKTRLNCSLNGFYFDQLQGVSDPVDVHVGAGSSNNTMKMIYMTFTTPGNAIPGSAVCAFSLDAIHNSLLGRFREEGKKDPKTSIPTGNHHPGNCPNEKYTESELLFLKSHPILEDQAIGTLHTTHVGESWTSLGVDSTAGPYKNWTVYFVGTEEGQVLRYLAPTSGLKTATFLRKENVYDKNRCSSNSTGEYKKVTSIVADPERGQILVAFKHCVISVPLTSCSIHECRESCLASADPYCGWNGNECVAYTAPSGDMEQEILSNALHGTHNIKELCPTKKILKSTEKVDPVLENKVELTTPNKDVASRSGDQVVVVENNCSQTVGKNDDSKVYFQSQSSRQMIENGYVRWELALGICAGLVALSILIVYIACKFGCSKNSTKEVPESTDLSKTSIALTVCEKARRIIAAVSPKRSRKQPGKASSVNHSQSNIADSQEEPLVGDSKSDDYVKTRHRNDVTARPQHPARDSSISMVSQVTMSESLPSYDPSRRNSSQPTASVSSIPRGHVYHTAPRPRHYSGNRTSDPSDYSNTSTLRADKMSNRVQYSRHSTPVPQVVRTPTSIAEGQFDFAIENTEYVLQGVKEVIDNQQRRSQEMEALPEEPTDARERHNSSDSGKGSSPRNSMQNDDERQNKLSSLRRPADLAFGNNRGRKRLNSEPTSPTINHQPLAPQPANHKAVGRSSSMSVKQGQPDLGRRKRSESFSFQANPSTPSGKASPPRLNEIPNGYHQSPQHNIYSTLPIKPNVNNSRRQQHPSEQFNRQTSYRYPQNPTENGVHPAMQMPGNYSSLPARSQAHRSNTNKPFVPHPSSQMNRHSTTNGTLTMQQQPHYHKQFSSPAKFDQRLKYVKTPTVPVQQQQPYHGVISQQNAV